MNRNKNFIRPFLISLGRVLVLSLFLIPNLFGQTLSLDQAVQTALKNNLGIRSAEYQIEYLKELKKTATDIGKLSAVWTHGQYNSFNQDNNVTFSQSIPFPTTLSNQVELGKEQIVGARQNLIVQQNNLAYEVKSVYQQLLYQIAVKKLLLTQDSLYTDFAKAASLRFKIGETNLLEKTTAETQLLDLHNLQQQNEADLLIYATRLQAFLKSENLVFASDPFVKRTVPTELESPQLLNNPSLKLIQQDIVITNRFKRTERSRIMPDLMIGGFAQSLTGWVTNTQKVDVYYPRKTVFAGWQVGLAIPIWIKPNLARAKAAAYQEEIARNNAQHYEVMLNGNFQQAARELEKANANINYYETSALKNAALLISQARKSFQSGEIGYIEYLQALKNSNVIRNNYLQALMQYNQAVIKIEFLLGKI